MKKLCAILLTCAMLFGIYPHTAIAAEISDFDQQFSQYLSEISAERGFEVTKDDVSLSLSMYDLGIEDFSTVEELRSTLGEVIKADLSNINSLYEAYALDEVKLGELLAENGDTINDYVFIDDLDFALSFYTEDNTFEREPNFDQNLTAYLETISTQRGFVVTKENLEAILADYQTSLDTFETVESVRSFLGEVIKADYSNLDTYFQTYGLDKQSVLQTLEDNGKNINDYVYLDDLAYDVYSNGNANPVINEDFINNIFSSIGLTDTEMKNLENYFTGLEDYFTSAETLDRLTALQDKLLAFADNTFSDTLTDEQIAEIEAIYKEYLSIFKINFDFSLVKDGTETPISYSELLRLTELQDSGLKITISDVDGQFLADLTITSDLFNLESGNIGTLIEGTASDLVKQVTQPADALNFSKAKAKTAKGAKLPKTASGYLNNTLFGLLCMLTGIVIYQKVKNTGSEVIEK